MIAELLAGLPDGQRADVIAELTPADRVAVARLLIGKGSQDSR